MRTIFKDLWHNIKCMNILIIGVTEGEQREKGIKKAVEEMMVENLPNLKKETDIQVQELGSVSNKIS